MKIRLYPDMIPKSCWFSNVRSEVPKYQWDKIRKIVYKRDKHTCRICGGRGNKHPVEAHEIWEFKNGVQKLKGIVSLCPKCHQVKHFGLSTKRGLQDECVKHMMEVNNCNKDMVIKIIEKTIKIWQERSKQEWELDISIIQKFLA